MKFAEHLSAHITPEWRKQYINYEVSFVIDRGSPNPILGSLIYSKVASNASCVYMHMYISLI